MERIDVAVIGAGVTGLASALAVATRGQSVCVLERHPRPGLDTSTHNSGVIHGGIYYPAGTLKSRLSIAGRRLLYEFCKRHTVPHARCGKLIVALTQQEVAGLDELQARGEANGVPGLSYWRKRTLNWLPQPAPWRDGAAAAFRSAVAGRGRLLL